MVEAMLGRPELVGRPRGRVCADDGDRLLHVGKRPGQGLDRGDRGILQRASFDVHDAALHRDPQARAGQAVRARDRLAERRSDVGVVRIRVRPLALAGEPARRALLGASMRLDALVGLADERARGNGAIGNRRRDLEERIVEPVAQFVARPRRRGEAGTDDERRCDAGDAGHAGHQASSRSSTA